MKIKLLHILFILALACLVFTGCKKEDSGGQNGATTDKVVEEKQLINEPRWVTSDAGLRIRERPVDGDKIGAIPYQGEVLLLEEIGDDVTISNTTGKWSRIKYQDIEGWVFGGFLSSENPFVNRQTDELLITKSQVIGKWIRETITENGIEIELPTDETMLLFDDSTLTITTSYDYGDEVVKGKWTIKPSNIIHITLDDGTTKNNFKILEIKEDLIVIETKTFIIKYTLSKPDYNN